MLFRSARALGAGRGWALVGVLGITTGLLVLSFYSVIGGWTIAYTADTLRLGLDAGDPAAAQARLIARSP